MNMTLESLKNTIFECKRCPRLRSHCLQIAETKKKAHLNETYWGKPISGFGDPKAKLLIVGLAPAAHGANRTGRIFTGDRSGEWLYGALHRHGYSNQPYSSDRNDGMKLKRAYITCAARCAPPENLPSKEELAQCLDYLKTELQLLKEIRVVLALGGIAYDTIWPLLNSSKPAEKTQKKPKFKHGLEIPLSNGIVLLTSFHPSQQNTFTGRLTQKMWDSVFLRAKALGN
jgi:uracil-DNA glycosylase family 4